MRVTHAVEGDGFVTKVFEQRPFKLGVGDALQGRIERFDDDGFRRAVRGRHVARQINLRIAAASETFDDVVTPVEPALLKLEFTHP